MQETLHQGKEFSQISYTGQRVAGREFDDCTFKNCDFSHTDFSGSSFTDCRFEACNLSLMKLNQVKLQDVFFQDCKLVGVDFGACHDFLLSMQFKGCSLDYAYFGRKNLRKTIFEGCSIKEANFTETDLAQAAFRDCDLDRTVFQRTNLEKADFRTAYHYTLDPELNRVRKAKFSAQGALGLLAKYDLDVQ
ncbi:pentapeptide repeat-containing protein [Rufibacter psychrotolerans]|uniref:pentapeptide repeat-containing protein n=1 Tax=Rufibacter psychrotolerans TaxID=2812556 RepID=UPI0019683222|nr:pentapeptide repeat-containing protein [Rufibacter sp. SYSU D00308]